MKRYFGTLYNIALLIHFSALLAVNSAIVHKRTVFTHAPFDLCSSLVFY